MLPEFSFMAREFSPPLLSLTVSHFSGTNIGVD